MSFDSEKAVQTYETKKITPLEKFLFHRFLKNRVLDLGCGTGRTTLYIHNQGYQVTGIDISEPMIKQARLNHPKIRYYLGDMANLEGHLNNYYGTVLISFNSLDYVYPFTRRIKALCEAYRVLENGGYLIYSSHNRKRLPWRRLINGKIRPHNYHYWREKTVHGKYLTYWGTPKENTEQLTSIGFNLTFSQPEKSWVYYVAQTQKGEII